MNHIGKEALNRIRQQYTVGARVELTKMNDPYRTDLVPGCRGTVRFVDDMGTIHVRWVSAHRWELYTVRMLVKSSKNDKNAVFLTVYSH